MITVISPSKKLHETPKKVGSKEQFSPFLEETQTLISQLKTYSSETLADLLHISPKLAELNYDRYQGLENGH